MRPLEQRGDVFRLFRHCLGDGLSVRQRRYRLVVGIPWQDLESGVDGTPAMRPATATRPWFAIVVALFFT
jgi:hypothetical protein